MIKTLIDKISNKKIANIFNLDTVSTWNEAIETCVEITKQHFMMLNSVDENGIKFCPFCGNQATVYKEMDYPDDEPHHHIRCRKCNISVTHISGKKDDVIEKWNKRS
jgi:Lar family restriction alleviation protein